MVKAIIKQSDIKEALEKHINKVFPINYTKQELECIAQIDITNGNVFSHYGKIGNINPSKFIQEIGNNSPELAEKFTKIVNKLTNAVCKGYGQEHAWISIRVRKPNNDYDIPRWHMDGHFFIEDRAQIQTKFITVFRGSGTLMIDSTIKEREKYYKILSEMGPKTNEEFEKYVNDKKWQMDIRNKQNAIFTHKKTKQLQNDEGLIFIVGNMEKALVHSEPPMHENRIFISILPGTERQIENLKKRRKINN